MLAQGRERNIELNIGKFRFKEMQVPNCGHLVTSEGLQTDPRKTASVKEMPPLADVADLRHFLGMTKLPYLARFIPSLLDLG